MQIHTFARLGDIPGVARELANGIDVDCVDETEYQTPLVCAITSPSASVEMLKLLVSQGANVNALVNEYPNIERKKTVLGFALKSGNFEKIQYLLDAGANINYQNQNGYDALMDAMYSENASLNQNLLSILNLLISRGASASGVSSYGESAISIASRIGRFDAVKLLLESGADAKQLGWTELMHSIAFQSADDVKELLNKGADLTASDGEKTPWLLSVHVGDISKAKLLLSAGANRDDCGFSGKTPLMFAIDNNNIEILQWLIAEGFDIEATNEYESTALMVAAENGRTDCVRILLEAGANPSKVTKYDDKAITLASNLQIVKMLVQAGEDLSEISNDMRRLLTQVNYSDIQISSEQYLAGKHRRFGTKNPELMDIDFWQEMVRNGQDSYYARKKFGDENYNEPVWCYDRFGRTITELPDGRIIEIAGEHEDFCDPDFCIYNDIVVYTRDGNFQIFGYPEEIFPPTDFHSATLVGEYIYIIGNLGYDDQRITNETPVYRLDCKTFKIEKVETSGEKPGWISKHKASYKETNKIYITGGKLCVMVNDEEEYVDNSLDCVLDLTNFTWSRLSK
ncbi:MAG: ankyrin repeat domain-containing protein [Stigonema ocellatum SAG 48.90 = DSM 106950]|nr:ankyrin repeat domain-containing protein [Stigonema ocellatum SAG 48.90 = DSM 106950]